MLRWSKGVILLHQAQNVDIRSVMTIADLSGKICEGKLLMVCLDMLGGEMQGGNKVLNLRVGTKGRGRQMTRWKDCVEEDMRERDVQPRDAEEKLE